MTDMAHGTGVFQMTPPEEIELFNPQAAGRLSPPGDKTVAFLVERGADGKTFSKPVLLWGRWEDRGITFSRDCECRRVFRIDEVSAKDAMKHSLENRRLYNAGARCVCACYGRVIE